MCPALCPWCSPCAEVRSNAKHARMPGCLEIYARVTNSLQRPLDRPQPPQNLFAPLDSLTRLPANNFHNKCMRREFPMQMGLQDLRWFGEAHGPQKRRAFRHAHHRMSHVTRLGMIHGIVVHKQPPKKRGNWGTRVCFNGSGGT